MDPACPGASEPFVRNSTAARTTTAAPSSTHGRQRSGLPALDSRTFIASARSRRRRLGIRPFQRTGQIRARMRQEWVNCQSEIVPTQQIACDARTRGPTADRARHPPRNPRRNPATQPGTSRHHGPPRRPSGRLAGHEHEHRSPRAPRRGRGRPLGPYRQGVSRRAPHPPGPRPPEPRLRRERPQSDRLAQSRLDVRPRPSRRHWIRLHPPGRPGHRALGRGELLEEPGLLRPAEPAGARPRRRLQRRRHDAGHARPGLTQVRAPHPLHRAS